MSRAETSAVLDPVATQVAAQQGTMVCGVSGSAGGAAAVDVACELADRLGLRLVLLAVVDGFVAADGQPIDSLHTVQGMEGARRLLHRVVAERALATAVEGRLAVGEPVELLARIAQEEGADLILIGSGRRRRLRGRPTDGIAARLRAASSCPVLVVPRPAAARDGGGAAG